MKRILALLSLVLLVGLATEASAQARTVTGRVTSAENGQPLAGVTVLVKGTSTVTRTDVDGRYRVNVPATATTLNFSSLEYGARDVPIVGTTVDVQLTRQAIAFEAEYPFENDGRKRVYGRRAG